MCQCNTQNCGCVPSSYTSALIYDGLKFTCPSLAVIKPNCSRLNTLLELIGSLICGLITTQNPFSTIVLPIGAWDMDADSSLIVPHGLTATEFPTITGIRVLIDDDALAVKLPLETNQGGAFNGFFSADATNINLDRIAASLFDAVGYSSIANSRGSIIINYTKD